MNALTKRYHRLKAFHQDEGGMETIQVVIIVALAAIVVVVVFAFWKDIKGWAKTAMDKFKSDKPTD